jgi:hypothetical protein
MQQICRKIPSDLEKIQAEQENFGEVFITFPEPLSSEIFDVEKGVQTKTLSSYYIRVPLLAFV